MVFLVFTSFKPIPKEYQVKAVFLYNFTQFIEWPTEAFALDKSPFVIGVLGNDPFGNYLDKIVKNEKLGDHPLIIKRFKKVREIGNCHILFINLNKETETDFALDQLKAKNILLVGDKSHGFLEHGGMICFFLEEDKIRMRINLNAIKEANLSVSSKLLRVAEIIHEN